MRPIMPNIGRRTSGKPGNPRRLNDDWQEEKKAPRARGRILGANKPKLRRLRLTVICPLPCTFSGNEFFLYEILEDILNLTFTPSRSLLEV